MPSHTRTRSSALPVVPVAGVDIAAAVRAGRRDSGVGGRANSGHGDGEKAGIISMTAPIAPKSM